MAQLAVTFAEIDASRPSAAAGPRLDAAQVDDPEITWRAAREPAQTCQLLDLLDGEVGKVDPTEMAALPAWPLLVQEYVLEFYKFHCSLDATRAATVMFDVDSGLPDRPTLHECAAALVAAKVLPVDVPSVVSWVARTRALARGELDPGPLPEPLGHGPDDDAPPGPPPPAAIAPAPPLPAAREAQALLPPDRDGAPLPAAAPPAPGGAQAGGPPPAPPAPPLAPAASPPVIMTQAQQTQLIAASVSGRSAKSPNLEAADRVDTTAHAKLLRKLLHFLANHIYFDPVLLSPAYLEKLLYDPLSNVSKRVVVDTEGQFSLESQGLDAACAALSYSDFRSGCDAMVALLRDPGQPCYDPALADDRQAFFAALWAMHTYPQPIVRSFAKVFMTKYAAARNWAAEVKSNALMLATHLITPPSKRRRAGRPPCPQIALS